MEAFDDDIGPSVVLASPGMMQSGLSRELFEKWCTNKRNGVILAGYAVEGKFALVIESFTKVIEEHLRIRSKQSRTRLLPCPAKNCLEKCKSSKCPFRRMRTTDKYLVSIRNLNYNRVPSKNLYVK